MKIALLIVVSLVSAGSVFAQNRDADGLAAKTYLEQTKQAVSAAEASATFIRDQLTALRGKLDYYADPKRSNVHSRADLKDHFGDLNDPVRESILRIHGLKESLDALNSSFTRENPKVEPSLIRMLPTDKYEYAGEIVNFKALKAKLTRAGSLDRYKAVKIVVSKTDSPITLARIIGGTGSSRVSCQHWI